MITFISQQFPDRAALLIDGQAISYTELSRQVHLITQNLRQLPTGILALEAAPNLDFIRLLLAALTVGQPIALLGNQLPAADKKLRLDLLSDTLTVDAQGTLVEHQANTNSKIHPQLALVLFTSGTTGQVKGVQLSLQNIMANCQAVITALEFAKVKDQLLFLPLSYSFGLLGQLIPGLMTGITTHLITQFTDIKALLEQQIIPEMWSGVPSHWVAITRMAAAYPESAAQIKALVSAGAPLPLPLRKELRERFPQAIIYNNYGLTEAAPRVLTYSSKDPLFFEDYAGYPVGDWQIQLSEQQELLIKGPQVMLGYLGDEEHVKIQEGWLYTGDQAEIQSSGLVAIKGRQDHLVNVGGEKVSLSDIEQQIGKMNGIQNILVLPLDDDIYGVRLLICLEHTILKQYGNEQSLLEQIRNHLLPKKLPITLYLIKQLPRNHHGKLDRKMVLAEYVLDCGRKKT